MLSGVRCLRKRDAAPLQHAVLPPQLANWDSNTVLKLSRWQIIIPPGNRFSRVCCPICPLLLAFVAGLWRLPGGPQASPPLQGNALRAMALPSPRE
jgi:hypothetical protein